MVKKYITFEDLDREEKRLLKRRFESIDHDEICSLGGSILTIRLLKNKLKVIR